MGTSRKYEKAASVFTRAIMELASKPENLDNLNNYLSQHFGVWLEKYANSPCDIAAELQEFARIEF